MANAQDKEEAKLRVSDSSRIVKVISGLNSRNKKLQDRYIKQEENFDRERKGWDRDRKKWSKKLGGANTEIQKLRTHSLELIDVTRCLQIENARKEISLAESNAKYDTKLEKIKSLRNKMKLLKGKLDLSQKDSSKKGSEIESLKSKIVELALKISELERLKPEDISGSIGSLIHDSENRLGTQVPLFHNTTCSAISGGDDEKNTLCEEQSSITKP